MMYLAYYIVYKYLRRVKSSLMAIKLLNRLKSMVLSIDQERHKPYILPFSIEIMQHTDNCQKLSNSCLSILETRHVRPEGS